MRFVPIKTDEQLDLQALHRVRDRLVGRRTAVINQLRGFLLERGITFRKGPAGLRNHLAAMLEDAQQNLSRRMRRLIDHLRQEWSALEVEIGTSRSYISPLTVVIHYPRSNPLVIYAET